MKLHGYGAIYKVVEFNKGIIVLNGLDNMMQRPDAIELVVADGQTCGEYLMKYLYLRCRGAAGVDRKIAHEEALQGLIVIRKANLDG
jgi:hypothetical protein